MRHEVTPYIKFDRKFCTGCLICVKACPTQAIRVKNNRAVCNIQRCIGCGVCIRICPESAVSPNSYYLEKFEKGMPSAVIVSPVLYSQFPGIMPYDVLHAVLRMGFDHVFDLSYYIEMVQFAIKEFIIQNRVKKKSPWPLISSVCPVVVRLIAFRFPDLIPNILPVLRPVALISSDIRQWLEKKYKDKKDEFKLYYITPCPYKIASGCSDCFEKEFYVDYTIGINDVYGEILRYLKEISQEPLKFSERNNIHYPPSGTGILWGVAGGDVENINIEKSLAVSGLRETITYLEKIEIGLFKDTEYIELKSCPEGCLGSALNVIDKYIAKHHAYGLFKKLGPGASLPQAKLLKLYESKRFFSDHDLFEPSTLTGIEKEVFSFSQIHIIEKIVDFIKGQDCALCGAPNCNSFAQDVVKGRALIEECAILKIRGTSALNEVKHILNSDLGK